METTELGIIELKPPVHVDAKRKYRVGIKAHMSWLRLAYYEKRGWIRDEYYIRPEQSALTEWLHCLVSPARAQHTWLKLAPEAEERAAVIVKRIVIGLFIAVAFTAGIVVGEVKTIHQIKQLEQRIELRSAERTI